MGHKCDVCDVGDATIFCFADQAVMCDACDRTVHTANKLVNKHERVTLGKDQDTSKCDICTEAPAVMFCSEDRALICRRCDLMIHTANELTAQHHRYLLSPVSVGLRSLPAPAVQDAHTDMGSCHTNNGSTATGFASRNGSHYQAGTSSAMYGSRYRDPGPSGVPMVPMDKGKAPLLPAFMESHRENSLGTLISNSNAVHTSTGAGLLDPMRNNAGAEALLRGVAQRTNNGNDDTFSQNGQHRHSNHDDGHDALVPGSSAHRYSGEYNMFSPRQPNGLILAADLLGVPNINGNYTAKDVQETYSFFDSDELDGEISALLEVPDIDFNLPGGLGSRPPSFDMPGAYRGLQFSNLGSSGSGYGSSSRARRSLDLLGGDGVVPDLTVPSMSFQTAKRQRT